MYVTSGNRIVPWTYASPFAILCKSWRSDDSNLQPEFLGYQYNGFQVKLIPSQVGNCTDCKQSADRDIFMKANADRYLKGKPKVFAFFINFISTTIVLNLLIVDQTGTRFSAPGMSIVAHRKEWRCAIFVIFIIWQCTTIALRWFNWVVCFIFLHLIEGSLGLQTTAFAPRVHRGCLNKQRHLAPNQRG